MIYQKKIDGSEGRGGILILRVGVRDGKTPDTARGLNNNPISILRRSTK
jgi:hypothetical protein